MPDAFHPGQRWTSESEPELGLGSVLRVTGRTVVMEFPASGETREYAADNAPLRRVRFRAGDVVRNRDGASLAVSTVALQGGLLYYLGDGLKWCEAELNDSISCDEPGRRLLNGQVDEPGTFDLRVKALVYQHRRRKSPVRGFTGGRIDLIPHQLYIASEVAGRLAPRVLLADEVGLGKTIEACLILHRLILTGRARRVLVLVPDSLVHQWFIELMRRFNLWFHIFDEERCDAIESANPEVNPFLDDQLILSSIHLFAENDRRLTQAVQAGWDMVVVDEAHHLGWSPDGVSQEYRAVDALGRISPGLLLLTATPEQLGIASHFARLRLLDPDRFFDLETFAQEAASYRDIARLSDKLLAGTCLDAVEITRLSTILRQPEDHTRSELEKIACRDQQALDRVIDALLDQHGTGRVMLRNTRHTVTGFPCRVARLASLQLPSEANPQFENLACEFEADISFGAAETFEPDFAEDPRVDWLAGLLRQLEREKVLLICRTQRKAEAIEAALRQRLTIPMAVFHEGLPLVKRDRNAAWFAEEDGARLLICSEIGSEGRNFQFAHHLVLFDLPLDPELLEQRLGRLDRIGQRSEIQIHVPFVSGSSQEVLVRWYHEGLNSFERNLQGGRALLEQFGERVRDLAQDFHETEETSRDELTRLLAETRAARDELTRRLEQGRDRLLELNSFRAPAAKSLVEGIQQQDQDRSLDEFMTAIFDHYNIHSEELTHRTFQLGSAGVFADTFPGLPAEGLTVTCDRQRALSREDVQFLTWDHPLVTGALDLLLGSDKGTCSFGLWTDGKGEGLYLEVIHLLECVAPPRLHVDRFLPPTPLRVVVDQNGVEAGALVTSKALAGRIKPAKPFALLDQPDLHDAIPSWIESAEALTRRHVSRYVEAARKTMQTQLDHEVSRLRELQKVNRSVRPEEIEQLLAEQRELDRHLTGARLRLDAVRLIQRM